MIRTQQLPLVFGVFPNDWLRLIVSAQKSVEVGNIRYNSSRGWMICAEFSAGMFKDQLQLLFRFAVSRLLLIQQPEIMHDVDERLRIAVRQIAPTGNRRKENRLGVCESS